MLRHLPLLTTILFLGTVIPDQLAAQNDISLSMKQTIELALRNNPDVGVAEYNTRSAEYAIRESKGNFLPKISLVGNYTRNIDKPVIFLPEGFGGGGATEIGSDNNFSAYLDLSVPLYSRYNGSARNYTQQYFHWQQENLKGAQLTVVANVRKAYYACLVAAEAVRVREKALQNAEQISINTKNKLVLGVATEYDETTAKVRESSARNDLLEAMSQLTPVENSLKLLLGLPADTEVILIDSLYLGEEELAGLPDAGELMNNSSLKQKQLMVEVSKQQTAMARSSYFPALSGIGTYQYQTQQNNFRFSSYNWVLSNSVGLRLQMPIFNGIITRSKVQQLVIYEGIAKTQKDQVARYNDTQYSQLVSRLKYLKQRLHVHRENIALAAKAIELVKERYHYGKASLLEVNSAELDYVTARLGYLQAIADYKSNYCDLELLTGK